MKPSLFGALLGCTALFPALAMAADTQPPAPATTQTGEVTVQQPAPRVHVSQPEPKVTVRQPKPEIIVRQPAPVIAVKIPQPQIIVRMPKPEVSVATPQPQISVSEAKPQVQVQTAKPQVNVMAAQQSANVEMQQARPVVRYEQTGKAKVFVKRPEGQPTVRYEQMTAANGPSAAQQGAANTQQVKVSELLHTEAYDANGNKLGKVDGVVQNNAGTASLVIGHGSALNGKEVLVPLNDVRMANGRLVIQGVTAQQLAGMPEWNANNRNMKQLKANQAVVVYTQA